MTFKEISGSKRLMFSMSAATVIAIVIFIFTIGGKYRIAEQGIGKVPNIESKVDNHETRITKLETTMELKFKSIDDKLEILVRARRDR